ncbi:MAG: glycosyltransferase family 4 protein [Lachnospiraceae bacterium]|nr:glycosyltransferase family 4 protein [Lachnospiraceae bacterium]
MKILIVSHEYPPIGGGGANACMNLAHEFKTQGHDVTVVTTWFEGLDRRIQEDGLTIVRLPSKRKHLEYCGFGEMLSYLRMALAEADRLQKEKRFDAVMVFFAIPSGPIGYYLKKRYKVPYIIRFGGGDIPGFQDRFRVIYKLIGPFEKIIWKNAAALVANSKGLKTLAEKFDCRKEIQTIPNGVDIKFFEENAEKKEAEEYRILFVSRLIERKGLQFVLPQLRRLQKACKKKIMLTVVGDGPYRTELEHLVKEEGIEDCVKFVGQKNKSELQAYYKDADVFILPSKKEGMPNVVLEAMASGLPIVMTPCEGSEELIDGNGYVAEAGAFAEKLETLSKDSGLRMRMGQRSVELVYERFLWSGVAKEYGHILEKVSKKE